MPLNVGAEGSKSLKCWTDSLLSNSISNSNKLNYEQNQIIATTAKTNESNQEAKEGNSELLAAITWPFAFLMNSKRSYNVKHNSPYNYQILKESAVPEEMAQLQFKIHVPKLEYSK